MSGRGQHQPIEGLAVAMPQCLRDQATDRVADRDEPIDAYCGRNGDHVIGTLLPARSDLPPVSLIHGHASRTRRHDGVRQAARTCRANTSRWSCSSRGATRQEAVRGRPWNRVPVSARSAMCLTLSCAAAGIRANSADTLFRLQNPGPEFLELLRCRSSPSAGRCSSLRRRRASARCCATP